MITLTEPDVQDLAQLLVGFVCKRGKCHQDMDMLAKRFGVDPADTHSERSAAIATRSYLFLNLLNGTPVLLQVLSYVIERFSPEDSKLIETYSGILRRYGLEIEVTSGKCRLVGTGVERIEETKVLSWLEKNASTTTQKLLADAKEALGEGRFDDVLHYCRKSIESLTCRGAFSDALSELASRKVIFKADRPDRRTETELFQTIYGYCSTLGSHAGPLRADLEHARLALGITEGVIYFLLRRVVSFRENGGKLQEWV
jgi:hypothetical protein